MTRTRAWILAAALLGGLLVADSLTGQHVTNALTRGALQAGNWVTTGSWSFAGTATHTGPFSLPAYATGSLPNPCVVGNIARDSTTAEIKKCRTASPAEWVRIAYQQYTLDVCNSGCAYTNVNTALTAITDSSATKPYTILVYPGSYLGQTWNMKSYVTVQCVGTWSTDGGVVDAGVVFPAGVTRAVLANCSVKSTYGNANDDTGAPTTNYIIGNYIGGTTSVDCLLDNGAGHTYFFINNVCAVNVDPITMGRDCTLYSSGNTFMKASDVPGRWPVFESHQCGARIYSQNDRVVGGVVSSNVSIIGQQFSRACSSSTRQSVWDINGLTVDVYGTTGVFLLVDVGTGDAYPDGAIIRLNNVNARATYSGAATVVGVKVNTDADNANFSVEVTGGSFAGSTVGGTFYDVDNSDGSGITVTLAGWKHSGTYNGTEAPLVGDMVSARYSGVGSGIVKAAAGLLSAGTVLSTADLAVGSCTVGDIQIDSGGATVEVCYCHTADTWGCTKMTDGTFTANGPAD